MDPFQQARRLAEQTPADRNRAVDFLRVAALSVVVIGHWLVIEVTLDNGLPTGSSALASLPWAHWLTWFFQVIPIFFLIGGYANTASWRSHVRRDGDWGTWLSRRELRLLWPTAIFCTVATAMTAGAAALGVPLELLRNAADGVSIILWFLAVYVVVAALTPLAVAAHDRWGLAFVLGTVGLVALLAGVRFLTGQEWYSYGNYLLVWGAFHQIGVAWRDGAILVGRRPVQMAVTSALTLAALVTIGPYPISMITVPGAEMQNTAPPSLALLFLGMTQGGVVLMVRHPLERWLQARRVWPAVVAGNAVVMSAFLWHVVPVVIVAVVLWMADVSLPSPVGSPGWLAFRPVWISLLALVLVPVLLAVTQFERPPARLEDISMPKKNGTASLVLAGAGIAAASRGLTIITTEGFWAGPATAPPLWGLALILAGLSLLVVGGGLGRKPSDRLGTRRSDGVS